ncbi:hypothetical protein QBC46DRAFT_360323 [Diplogelasinospora grovesii]|uniref:Vegetative cell wall protein gp1 n=1 Tax=Diplogelasinospora grovesii TaxID=303347 RepID=A0AAN6NH37_9PEZI|nr:hypothetical protein QBC46DRAFT_360323 [Diplogelasinospora grovesii]
MATYSPYGSTPAGDYFFEEKKFPSPSPTPSPRGPAYQYGAAQQRPATRAHFRNGSVNGFANNNTNTNYSSPRGSFSPRYTSDGQYATANVSQARYSRKPSFSGFFDQRPKRERRNSYSYSRSPDSHGVSDEDEFIEINGISYVMLPAQSKSKRNKRYFTIINDGGHGTDHHHYAQGGPFFDRDSGYASPRFEPPERKPTAVPVGVSHSRRNSASVPQRPQTARPASSHKKTAPPPTTKRQATEADAKKWRIPQGFSMKNWDPAEDPIMLLGSVFDANSLGKWIYDWTVYRHGASAPISDMAGELWLLLIQVAGKVKRADDTMCKIRKKEFREMMCDFIDSGERLMDKLGMLLTTCENAMLRVASSKRKEQLGKNAGIEFVDTFFGRERELPNTESLMASMRLWNLRFDTNCEEVLNNPTM